MSTHIDESTSGVGALVSNWCPRCCLDIIEHTFYNVSIATQKTCGLDGLEGLLVDEKEEYRKKIIEMVKNVNRKDILIYIFNIVEDIIKEDYNDGQVP